MSRVEFETDVVERSHTIPVVVDFWAPWCGPCRHLGPIIEKLAEEADGRWELVKLNTEDQPQVAMDHGIRGIPAVKMFHEGKIVAEFMGALPREQIQSWLDENLLAAGAGGGGGGGGSLHTIVGSWPERGPAIVPELEAWTGAHPDDPAGRLELARVLAVSDPDRARGLVDTVEVDADLDEIVGDIRSLAELAGLRDSPAVPEKLATHLDGAREALLQHDVDAALEHLVDSAMLDKKFGDELARRVSVAVFRLLGHDHDLTRKHQRRLAMALYS